MINRLLDRVRVMRACESILNAVFPRRCVACGLDREGGGDYLCGLCRQDIFMIDDPLCESCGHPADIDYDYPAEGFECGLCRKGAYRFDRARSLGLYTSVLKELIHFYKYGHQPGAIGEIEPLLKRYFEAHRRDYDRVSVVSVPLHMKKLKERGFDQAFILAHAIADILQAPLLAQPLKRVRETLPQARKDRKERLKDIKGAFAVTEPEAICGKNILVVDDVFTTGATVNEVARVLKKAKAGRIDVFTLARA